MVTSPQLKEEFEAHGIERVAVWNKGIDTGVFHPKYGAPSHAPLPTMPCSRLLTGAGLNVLIAHRYGAKTWWTSRQDARGDGTADDVGDGASGHDDTDALAAAALSMRTRLTDGHPEAPLLIYVGRLGVEKRLRDLKGVLARLPEETCLAVVGKGPDLEPLQEHFASTRTVFTGLLSGVELSRAFAVADVFLMPSDSETLGTFHALSRPPPFSHALQLTPSRFRRPRVNGKWRARRRMQPRRHPFDHRPWSDRLPL